MSLPRRTFIKSTALLAAGRFLPASALAMPDATHFADQNPAVRPMIGCGWRGHMFPGATAPFGFVQLSPDTSGAPEPRWNERGDYTRWEHCSGYHAPDDVLLGFSHTHLQGTGGIDLGDVLVMPVVEGRNWAWTPGAPDAQAEMQRQALGEDSDWVFDEQSSGYRSYFSHANEVARAGYYSVELDTPQVSAELTATTRCGLHRYRFPASAAKVRHGLMVDLLYGLGSKVVEAELSLASKQRIMGRRTTAGWAAHRDLYFVLELSRPVQSFDVSVDGALQTGASGASFKGKALKTILVLEAASEPLVVRVGLSGTSLEGAIRNLEAEIPDWDFDALAAKNAAAWKQVMTGLDAELPSRELAEVFDTSVYHSCIAPTTYCDVDGSYRGEDGKNHEHPGFTNYTTLSIWDIYRGQFPFLMLTQPQRIDDIVRTLLNDYRQLNQHALPMWPLWANETWSMTGFHAAGMILGAYVRDFRGFDMEEAYAAVRDTALVGAEARGNRILQEHFRQYGYVPVDLRGGSVSSTLDLSYDYWCAGTIAQLLGKKDDAEQLLAYAHNYKNLFDPSVGFMRGKTKDGRWREPFRPDEEYEDYVETDAWQASLGVPHDVAGLIELYGGDEAFIAKLDALFAAPSFVRNGRPDITGMVGQDAQGNEPSNHIPYLYAFAGAAWKTQYWVRKVAALYRNTPAGIPGNDDCGQLSSWFTLTAMGFYPVNAATGVYVIGSPLVRRVRIRVPKGKTFTVVAEQNSAENLYIQSASLNGKPLTRCWMTHAEMVAGGELRLVMGDKPNKAWGAAPADRPPSGLVL